MKSLLEGWRKPGLLAVSLVLLPSTLLAVPAEIPYVGYLTNNGVPYNEAVAITVELYDQATEGTSLWGPQQYDVEVSDGAFVVVLGSSNGVELDTALLPTQGWLEFKVDGSLLSQRQALQSVPYAVWASAAESLGDMGCEANQMLKWSAGSGTWVCSNDLGGEGAQYTAGNGLNLEGTEFSLDQPTVEAWAQGVCYHTADQLAAVLPSALPNWDQNEGDDLTTASVFGGDVTGSFSTLQLGIEVVDATNLATGSVTTTKVVDATLLFSDIAQNGCYEGETMFWNGSAWACELVYTQAQVEDIVASAIADYQNTKPIICGGVECPFLAAEYNVTCNSSQHCEYANTDASGWRAFDVWIYISPGKFWMGADSEGGDADEAPVHLVNITTGYFIMKYEITVLQYEACMGANPSQCTPVEIPAGSGPDWWDGNGWGANKSTGSNLPMTTRPLHPQNGLMWQQAKDFCAWTAAGGNLPTEAQWEYAATGPKHMKYPWGDSPAPMCTNQTAVFNEAGGTAGYGCGTLGTSPVGTRPAGASWSGALDTAGNVWEWCSDWYSGNYYTSDLHIDPNGPTTGTNRVRRGGSFYDAAIYLRLAMRNISGPLDRDANTGARCVRPLP